MSPLAVADGGALSTRGPAGPPLLALADAAGFQAASRLVLDYLNENVPMGFWSITRVENDRQTYLYLDDNAYGVDRGASTPWEDTYCRHMVAGTAPRIAPEAQAVPLYASAGINEAKAIAAYAGAPIAEPDGTLFGAICGMGPEQRPDLATFGPTLDLLGELLSLTLAGDRALHFAEHDSRAALNKATTDSLTGIHNRRAWDETITALDREFDIYADPTVIVVIDLDNLKAINDGPGGHAAGDRILRTAAGVMRRHIRDHDFLARIGGGRVRRNPHQLPDQLDPDAGRADQPGPRPGRRPRVARMGSDGHHGQCPACGGNGRSSNVRSQSPPARHLPPSAMTNSRCRASKCDEWPTKDAIDKWSSAASK